MRKEYQSKLKNCTLRDGVLTVPGISGKEIELLGDELRHDILSYEVPFWKPLGMKVTSGDISLLQNYISKVRGLNRSYAEFFNICNDLMFTDCSRKYVEEMLDNFDQNEWSLVLGCSDHISTGNGTLFYEGCGVQDIARSVIKDVDVATISGNSSIGIHFLLHYGSGSITFVDAAYMLRGTDFVPVSQVYDLTRVFTIKRYELGDKAIYFNYKQNINEDVIEDILRNYGAQEA